MSNSSTDCWKNKPMQVLLPEQLSQRLTVALKKAGKQEIGGILMGQHVADGVFRVRDLTVQYQGGSFASFTRLIREILSPLRWFFHETGYHFTRFNYLGEWHSHPSFIPDPSARDHETMRGIVEDPEVGANFVVLLIVRLDNTEQLQGTVTIYLPEQQTLRAELIQERTDV